MRIADLSGCAAKLDAAMQEFQLARSQAATYWNDHASRQLDEHYFTPLERKCRRALEALRRLNQVVEKAMRECE